MKRAVCLAAVLLLLLCGCSQNDESQQIDVGSFSYAEDRAYYKDGPGVKTSGFANHEESELNNAKQAVVLAKKECKVDYDTVDVAYDYETGMYRIHFHKEWADQGQTVYIIGGNQTVYINQNGTTQLIIYGE